MHLEREEREMSQFIELLATFHVSPVCIRGYEPSTTRSEARSTIAKLTHQKSRLTSSKNDYVL